MATCKSCGASITWHRTRASKMIPVDATPCRDGNIMIGPDGDAIVLPRGAEGDLFDVPRYKSHFSTCPQAKEHRKPSKAPGVPQD